jgi:hypothetical protein
MLPDDCGRRCAVRIGRPAHHVAGISSTWMHSRAVALIVCTPSKWWRCARHGSTRFGGRIRYIEALQSPVSSIRSQQAIKRPAPGQARARSIERRPPSRIISLTARPIAGAYIRPWPETPVARMKFGTTGQRSTIGSPSSRFMWQWPAQALFSLIASWGWLLAPVPPQRGDGERSRTIPLAEVERVHIPARAQVRSRVGELPRPIRRIRLHAAQYVRDWRGADQG